MCLRVRFASAAILLALLWAAPAEEMNDKARKYYDALLKRLAPGVVFDRFYNAWLDTGTLEEMEKSLRAAAEAADAGGAARVVLAMFYAKQNEQAKAAVEFARALEKIPNSAETWRQKAVAESRLMDFTASLASLEKALACQPAKDLEMQLRQLQGRLLARDGRPDEALKVWQQLLADYPDDAALHEDIIELQVAGGLNREALTTALALLARTADPYQKVQRHLRIGDLHARMGERDAAVAACTECLDDTGADSWPEKEILTQIEDVFRRDDAVDALQKHFAALVKKYPQRLSLHRRHARLLAERGDIDGAVRTFQNILALAPGDRAVREAYVDLLAQSKKFPEAVAQMKELMRLQPQDVELAARLADLEHDAGNSDGARAAAELFLRKSDQSEASHLRAAGLLERCKQPEGALALYQHTAEKFPDSEGAQDALAVALHRNGKKDEAAAAWRRLAVGAGKARLGNVARSAAAWDEHALAYELLSARAAEFQDDPVFLTQLCDEAARLEKYAAALPHARRLVSLAKDPGALETALILAVRMAERGKQTDALLTEFATAAAPQEQCLYAELLEKAGRRTEAEAALRKVAAAAPELAAALLVRLHSARGDDAAAALAMQSVVESPGGQKPAHVQRLVELLTRARMKDDAMYWISVWKKLSPGAPAPWQREAALYMDSGCIRDGLQTLRRAASLFEENADLKNALATACRDIGIYAEATRIYTALYENAKDIPDKVRLAGDLARTAQMAGTTEELIESFEERRRGNRTALAPLMSLVEIYRVSGNSEGRRAVMLEAARLAPDNKDLRLEMIRTAEAEGDLDRAIELMRELAATDKSGAMLPRLATMLYNAGREQESLKIMAGLAATGGVDARGAEGIAASLAAARAWPECIQFLAPFVAQYPSDYRLGYLYAVALEESGDDTAALAAFRRVAVLKDELPGIRAAPASPQSLPGVRSTSRNKTSLGGYQQQVIGFPTPLGTQTCEAITRMVPDLEEFRKLSDAPFHAYSHKRQQRISTSTTASGKISHSRAVSIILPSDVAETKGYALAHLARLTEIAGAATRAAVIGELEAAGLRHASVLMDHRQNPDWLTELYEKQPDSLILQLMLASTVAEANGMRPELIVELVGKLHPTHPAVAQVLAINLAYSQMPEHRRVFSEAVDGLLAQAENDATIRQLLVKLASHGVRSLRSTGERVPEWNCNPIQKIVARIGDWYRSPIPDSDAHQSLFHIMAGDFLDKQDLPGLVRLLAEEMAASTASPQTGQNLLSLTRGFPIIGENVFLAPVKFPWVGDDLPAGIAVILELRRASYFQGGAFNPGADELRPLLSQVTDPVLRTLLAWRSWDEALTAEWIPALDAMEKPTLSAVMLAASWAGKRGDYEKAATLLCRAPQPLTPKNRQELDGALVAWALQAVDANDGNPDENSPLIKEAREAALRLRHSVPGNTSNHRALATALRELGLEADAQRFLDSTPTLPSRSTSPSLTMFAAPEEKERVEMLVKRGRKAQAVKLLAWELKDILRSWAAGNTSPGDELKERADRLGLTAALLKAVDPGSKEDANTLATWGAAQEIFGDPVRAAEVYLNALARSPKSHELFNLWLRTALKSNPRDAVTGLLRDADPAMLAGGASVLRKFSYEVRATVDRIAVLEALEKWLASLQPDALRKADLGWACQWLGQFLLNANGEDEKKYGNLRGVRPEKPDGKVSDETIQVRSRWRTAAEKVCAHLMKNESQSAQTFSIYSSLKNALEPD